MLNKKIILLTFFLTIFFHLFADDTKTEIEIQPSLLGLGNVYLMDAEPLQISELDNLLKIYPESYSYVKKARVPLYIGCGFSFAGGGMVGYELGYSLASGEEINWGIIGIGASSIIIGYIFGGMADKQYEKGVNYYNQQ